MTEAAPSHDPPPSHDWFDSFDCAARPPTPLPPPPPPPLPPPPPPLLRRPGPVTTPTTTPTIPRLRSRNFRASAPSFSASTPLSVPTAHPSFAGHNSRSAPTNIAVQSLPGHLPLTVHRSPPASLPRRTPVRPRSYSSSAIDQRPTSSWVHGPTCSPSPPQSLGQSSPTSWPSSPPPLPLTPPRAHVHRPAAPRTGRGTLRPLYGILSVLVLLFAQLARHVYCWDVHCILFDDCPLTSVPLSNANCHTAWALLHETVESLVVHEIPGLMAHTAIITDVEGRHPEESYLALGDAAKSVNDIRSSPPIVHDILSRTILPACMPLRRIVSSESEVVPDARSAQSARAQVSRWQRTSAATFLRFCATSTSFLELSEFQRDVSAEGSTPSSYRPGLRTVREQLCQLTLPWVSHSLLWADAWHVAQTCPWDHAAKHARGHQQDPPNVGADDSSQQPHLPPPPPPTDPVNLATATQFTLASIRFDSYRISQMALLDRSNVRIVGYYELGLLAQVNSTRIQELEALNSRASSLTIVAYDALAAHVEFVRECDVLQEEDGQNDGRGGGENDRTRSMMWTLRHARSAGHHDGRVDY